SNPFRFDGLETVSQQAAITNRRKKWNLRKTSCLNQVIIKIEVPIRGGEIKKITNISPIGNCQSFLPKFLIRLLIIPKKHFRHGHLAEISTHIPLRDGFYTDH